MNREDLGSYFIKNGEIYYCFSYTEYPTVELENIRTGERRTIVVNSLVAKEYDKLFKIPVDDKYNLDLAEPVVKINELKEKK